MCEIRHFESKHLHNRHLQPVISSAEGDLVAIRYMQVKLLSLPQQMAKHTLLVAKTIWREAESYGVAISNPLMKIKQLQYKLLQRNS
jgi:hypothetical protein